METIPAVREVHPQTQRNTGRRCRAAQPARMRTAGAVGLGFLKHRFMPFEGYNFSDRRKAEAEVFRSVQYICSLYELSLPDTSGLCFPANMVSAHRQISDALEAKKGGGCYIMQDSKRMATLATVQPFSTGLTLYYIPVRPFKRLGELPELRPLADLLTLICAYLFQVTKVEYYRSYCYVGGNYESIEDWLNEDSEEADYFDLQMAELVELRKFGDSFLPELKKTFRLGSLERSLKTYHRSPCFDPTCFDLAAEFVKLIKDYPKRSIFDCIPQDLYGQDDYSLIEVDQYLSFYWGGSDNLNELFFDMVNNDLQESGEQVSPVAIQWFDTPPQREHFNHDYEARLFALIPELNYILYQYDHAKEYHP
ncbi:hypothetical protein FHW88_005178 [Mucilaginibacter sp. SG538B]|uniref:hypothetical protein n=1 Tax=Mucilaginibacter sp. SG538B TaxID=2587021 RepID=UPI00159EA97D|nr:hypothetical protein [Mucilaginibacter sp. SG538B]NVM66860.1 hypothetical protein [Mucilaginibacter sp. SG538B]